MRTLRLFFFGIDLRALALLRIALAAMLLFDLAKRVPSAGVWFINSGLLPNHRVLWHPSSPYQFSFLFSLWTVTQVRIAFAVFAAIYVCFLVGYRTRLFHVLAWLALLSLHTRTTFIGNGGDFVFCTILLWTAFMPLGSRWSLDSLLSRSDADARALNETSSTANPFVSLSVLAVRTQLCVIYLLNALNKTGQTWKEGSAVHYLLHQARIVTPLGIWLREHAPTPLLQAMTYGTLLVEYAIPFLIVVPWFGPWPRRLAVALIWGLHTNIALLANLGVFSPIMMVAALSLLSAEDFDWLASRQRVRRALERQADWIRGVIERTRLYVSERRAQLTELGSRVHLARARVRETVVALLIVCATSQLINENAELLPRLTHDQPLLVRAIIDYLRLNQGWSMFAPDAPRTDSWIVVDALTASGRHVDPYNVRASEVADPRLRSIPARLDQNVYFCNYTLRIPDEDDLHEPFQDWIFGHARRTRRPDEQVVRFDAYVIEQESPPLGQVRAGRAKARVFLSGTREE
jgi:hypothetical protein